MAGVYNGYIITKAFNFAFNKQNKNKTYRI